MPPHFSLIGQQFTLQGLKGPGAGAAADRQQKQPLASWLPEPAGGDGAGNQSKPFSHTPYGVRTWRYAGKSRTLHHGLTTTGSTLSTQSECCDFRTVVPTRVQVMAT